MVEEDRQSRRLALLEDLRFACVSVGGPQGVPCVGGAGETLPMDLNDAPPSGDAMRRYQGDQSIWIALIGILSFGGRKCR